MLPTALEAGIAISRRRAPRALRQFSTTVYLRSEGPSSSSSSSSSDPSSSSSDPSSSSSSQPQPTPAPSYPSPFASADPGNTEAQRTKRLDQLWDRVVSTPSAVLRVKDAPTRTILEPRPSYPRKMRGTTDRSHRAAGQTPHEASRFNAILSGILDKLHATEASTGEWAAGFNRGRGDARGGGGGEQQQQQQQQLPFEVPQFKRRDDDASPELLAAVDEAVEELSLLSSPAEAVAWAEANLFAATKEDGRTTYPAIYGRMFARVLAALRTRLNAPHVALALFEHARALGLESYLAGCNTAAYNELLATRWNAFRDLQGVYAGVREMEVNAVFWDKKTAAIVGGVVDEVGRQILGHRGSANRWGDDAYVALAQLEQRIAEDTVRQERIFDTKLQVKRRATAGPGGGFGGGGEARSSPFGYGRSDGPNVHRGRQHRSRDDEAGDWA